MATIKYDRTPPAPKPYIDEARVHYAVVIGDAFLGAFPLLATAEQFVEDRANHQKMNKSDYSIYPII